MSLDTTAKEQGRLHKSVYLPFLIICMNLYFYIFFSSTLLIMIKIIGWIAMILPTIIAGMM